MCTFSILFSYIDPVSGVILLQLIIGGGIGCLARFRHKIWQFGSHFFMRRKMTEQLQANERIILSYPRQPLGGVEPTESMPSLKGAMEVVGSQEHRKERIAA